MQYNTIELYFEVQHKTRQYRRDTRTAVSMVQQASFEALVGFLPCCVWWCEKWKARTPIFVRHFPPFFRRRLPRTYQYCRDGVRERKFDKTMRPSMGATRHSRKSVTIVPCSVQKWPGVPNALTNTEYLHVLRSMYVWPPRWMSDGPVSPRQDARTSRELGKAKRGSTSI